MHIDSSHSGVTTVGDIITIDVFYRDTIVFIM